MKRKVPVDEEDPDWIKESKEEEEELKEEPEEPKEDMRRRTKFKESDIAVIKKYCKELIESELPLSKEALNAAFNGTEEMRRMLDEFGFNSLKIKMRTERNRYLMVNIN